MKKMDLDNSLKTKIHTGHQWTSQIIKFMQYRLMALS